MGMLSSLSLDAVDVERLVNDITRRQYADCVQALEQDRKHVMVKVSVPKVRVHSEEAEKLFAKQRVAANKASGVFRATMAKREALLVLMEGPSPTAPRKMFGASGSDSDSDSSAGASAALVPELASDSDSSTPATPPRSRSSSFGGSSTANSTSRLPSTSPSRSGSPKQQLPRVKLPSSFTEIKRRSPRVSTSPKSPSKSLIAERLTSLTAGRSSSVEAIMIPK